MVSLPACSAEKAWLFTKTLASAWPQPGGKGFLRAHAFFAPQPQRRWGECGPEVRKRLLEHGGVVECSEQTAVGQTGDPYMMGEATASKRIEPLA